MYYIEKAIRKSCIAIFYHSRHDAIRKKICERHVKGPKVVRDSECSRVGFKWLCWVCHVACCYIVHHRQLHTQQISFALRLSASGFGTSSNTTTNGWEREKILWGTSSSHSHETRLSGTHTSSELCMEERNTSALNEWCECMEKANTQIRDSSKQHSNKFLAGNYYALPVFFWLSL